MILALIIVASYLLGAIPFGLVLGRLAGVDVRAQGSGNIGATNVARTAGKSLGLLTLLLDALKGALPPLIVRYGLADALGPAGPDLAVYAGLAAVVGHIFPIYLKLRGGKGVATAAGMFAAIAPLELGVGLVVFGAAYALSKVVSVGSLLGALALLLALVFGPASFVTAAAGGVVVGLIFVRHTGNIQRILAGRENRL